MRVEQSAAWGDFVAMQEALHARLSGELQSGSRLSGRLRGFGRAESSAPDFYPPA